MTYFEGGDLHLLTPEMREILIRAAAEVGEFPQVKLAEGLLPAGMPSSKSSHSQRLGPSL